LIGLVRPLALIPAPNRQSLSSPARPPARPTSSCSPAERPLGLDHGSLPVFLFVPDQVSAAAVTALSLAFLGLCCLAIAGLGRAWYRRDDLPRSTLALLALQVGLLLPLPLLRFYLTHNMAETAQGRHILFPAAAAIGLLLTAGASAWLLAAGRRLAGLALGGIVGRQPGDFLRLHAAGCAASAARPYHSRRRAGRAQSHPRPLWQQRRTGQL